MKAGLAEINLSALKICVGENKEKGFGNYFPKPILVGMTGVEPA